jgi:hypothetical protein
MKELFDSNPALARSGDPFISRGIRSLPPGKFVSRPAPSLGRAVPTTNLNHGIDAIVTPAAGGGGGTFTFPFQLQDHSVKGSSPVAKINVLYGTLNDVEPTNVGTDLSLTDGDGTYTFYLKIVVNLDGSLSSVELDYSMTGQPANDDYDGYITLGQADVLTNAVTAIRQAATHSLRYAVCGRVVSGMSLVTPGTFEFWGF